MINTDLCKAPYNVEDRIFTIRGVQVMLDRDLAELYEVDTKVLNQAVKRNIERFPDSWRFQLYENEKSELVTNCDRLEKMKHSVTNPFVFNEQGVAMLSAVLRSDTAVDVSIRIINAFVELRKTTQSNNNFTQRMDCLELHQHKTDLKIEKIFDALEAGSARPKQGIFFAGQLFDAYAFVSDLIKSAVKSIELWDNYVDESVLVLLSKRKPDVNTCIYTKNISAALRLDIQKHRAQYPEIEVKNVSQVHDRFLIIDSEKFYHMGASLKDLGKKVFAFSLLDAALIQYLRDRFQ